MATDQQLLGRVPGGNPGRLQSIAKRYSHTSRRNGRHNCCSCGRKLNGTVCIRVRTCTNVSSNFIATSFRLKERTYQQTLSYLQKVDAATSQKEPLGGGSMESGFGHVVKACSRRTPDVAADTCEAAARTRRNEEMRERRCILIQLNSVTLEIVRLLEITDLSIEDAWQMTGIHFHSISDHDMYVRTYIRIIRMT